MQSNATKAEFVRLLTNVQDRLFVYVLSLIPNPDVARDVVQAANLVMWEKTDEFKPGTHFNAWAMKIAYFQVLAHRRDQQRQKMVFNDGVLEQLAMEAKPLLEQVKDRRDALRQCVQELNDHQKTLVRRHYGDGQAVIAIARELGRSRHAVAMVLHRARLALMRCVEQKLGADHTP